MNKTFSVSEAISYGWNTFKNNWKFWVVVTLLVGIGKMGGGFRSLGSGTNSLNLDNYKEQLNNKIIEQPSEKSNSLISHRFNGSVLGAATKNISGDLGLGVKILINVVVTIVAIFIFIIMVATILAGVIYKMGHINLLLDSARNKELYYKTLLNQVSFKKAFRFLAASGLAGLIIVLGYMLFIIPGVIFTFKYMFVPFVVVDEDPGIRKALKRSSQITKGVRNKLFLYTLAMFGLSIVGILALGVGFYIVTIIGALSLAYIYVKVLEQEDIPQISSASTSKPSTEQIE